MKLSHLLKLEEEGETHFLQNLSHMFVYEMEYEVVRTVSFGPTEEADVGTEAEGGLTEPVGVEFVDGERFAPSTVVNDQPCQIFTLEMGAGGTGKRPRPRLQYFSLQLQPEVLSGQVVLELPPAGK